MRMAGPDIVLFVIGAVLFGGATFAIVALDDGVGDTSALGVFQVTYAAQLREMGSEDVASLRSATVQFEADATHPLRAVVLVECANAPAQLGAVPFRLQVDVQGPSGQSAQGSGQCGQSLVVEVPLGSMPPDTNVAGRTEEQARENLAPSPDAAAANGTWTVTVSGSRGQTTPAPIPVVDPAGTITFSIEEAAPRFAPIQR